MVTVGASKALSLMAAVRPVSDMECRPEAVPSTDKVALSPSTLLSAQSLTTTNKPVAGVRVRTQLVVPAGRAAMSPVLLITAPLSHV